MGNVDMGEEAHQSDSRVQPASNTVADFKLTLCCQDVVPESGTSLPFLTPYIFWRGRSEIRVPVVGNVNAA